MIARNKNNFKYLKEHEIVLACSAYCRGSLVGNKNSKQSVHACIAYCRGTLVRNKNNKQNVTAISKTNKFTRLDFENFVILDREIK